MVDDVSVPAAAEVRPGAEPLSVDGGRLGVVLCHGFTGSPASMRPWGQALAGAGYSVRVPLLPGHGTTWKAMNTTSWPQWYGELERAFDDLLGRCDRVAVAGLSMGGALSLRLAAQRPDDVAALSLVNPAVALRNPALAALPLIRLLVPSIGGIGNDIAKPGMDEIGYDRTPLHALASQLLLWKDVRSSLRRVRAPLLYFRSRQDHVVDDSSTPLIMDGVGSPVAELVPLERSFHVATLDHDAGLIQERTLGFLTEHLGDPRG